MRKRTIKSHYSLPITLCILFFSAIACTKEKPKETNIVCFAAKNKWVCAPEDQQKIANEKAKKLLVKNNSELETSEVVIRPINLPKFNTSSEPAEQTTLTPDVNTDNTIISKEEPNNNRDSSISTITKHKKNTNPYAELWSHQLIGVSTPQNAINYVRKHKLNKDDILIIQTVRNSMDWWIILFGLYKDKQTGLDNESNLPKNIDTPWLRPLKNLQVNGFIEKF